MEKISQNLIENMTSDELRETLNIMENEVERLHKEREEIRESLRKADDKFASACIKRDDITRRLANVEKGEITGNFQI